MHYLTQSETHSPRTDEDIREVDTVSKITAEWIEKKAKECYELLDDGFQWTDLFAMLPKIIEVAKTAKEMDEQGQKDTAVAIIEHIIDETDTPWVPDSITDPIIKKAAPYIVGLAFSAFYKDEEEE